MLVTNLPRPSLVENIEPGSLVHITDENLWGIQGIESQTYMLETRRKQKWSGMLGDFGPNYEIFVDPNSSSRFTYPWGDSNLRVGDLALFADDDEGSRSVIIGGDIDGIITTFELGSGQQLRRPSEGGEAIAYSSWGIAIKRSDRPGDTEQIYTKI